MSFQDEYRAMLASNPEPLPGLHGDGIVMALFERGTNAHASVTITINILRDLLGWQGGIQLWHVGDAPKICPNMQVQFVNATEVVKSQPGHIRSWCLKSYAIEHSGLARALWIDWDVYACRNPRPIFAELDNVDFYYWKNGPHWDDIANHAVIQSITSNPEPHSVQGGVYFLNCDSPGGWKMLQLQRIWDTYERETWGSNYDQDGWLLACTAGAGKYICDDGNPWVWPAWVSYYGPQGSTEQVINQCSCRGVPFFVHRCGEKIWNHKLTKFNRQLPLDEVVERLYHRALGDRLAALLAPPPPPTKSEIQDARIAAARRERGRVAPVRQGV